ncbi:sulfatase-like hydrolase/transferase [uncultured Thiodictyon sp.]|uniref:sulfatase-like hydrolase/transferase n=1 Tax=uncultured Thiodictyon sp. TaxID=1846217 RepID=UPI0025E94DAA|nr:sulfatase-like hydrolase/transferase [uncultured Thiodictyon sp.]
MSRPSLAQPPSVTGPRHWYFLALLGWFAAGAAVAADQRPGPPSATADQAEAALAPNPRGAATGPTTAKGYDHPDQFIHLKDVKPADNMYPVIAHPEQERQAREKLAALEKKTGKKPNILIFLLDDVGWMDPGFNGGGIAVGNDTPVMDRLAAGGLLLTSAYSTPSCSPTRASIHTGQNPLHHGLLDPPMYGAPGGLEGAVALPSVLKQLGYVTQGVGKWHLGENQASLPQNVGYDDYLGFLSVSDMYSEWRDIYFNPEIALSPARTRMMDELPFNQHEVHCTPSDKAHCQNGRFIDLDYIKDLDRHWMDYSVAFIRKQKDSSNPFFLYHATRGCHFDNYPSDQWAGKSRARTAYSDCMVEMDHVLGQLVKALEETGQLENTLVFFTSDNGPECEVPPAGRTPFRGCKGSAWEGGQRVPTFAYWKGMIAPRRSEGLFDLADLFNTSIALAGKPGAEVGGFVPKSTYLDGIDQTGLLLADQGESARRSRPYMLLGYFAAMRVDEFKWIFTAELEKGFFQKGYTGGFSGPIATSTGGGIMANLYTDPQEDIGVGLRHIPMMTQVQNAVRDYLKDLEKYPPRLQRGFGPNSLGALYDIIPMLKEAAGKRAAAGPVPGAPAPAPGH